MKLLQVPVKVGVVGTGYAAQKRAEAFSEDDRSVVSAIAGRTPERTQSLATQHNAQAYENWQELVQHPDLDLVVICTINRDHSAIAKAALEAGKHVVCEYPLALNPQEAKALIEFAHHEQKFLHIEHIEIIGGLHQALREYLPKIGQVTYARYTTITPQSPVKGRWTYHHEYFGFPFTAALSRIHRFTDLFGKVEQVTSQAQFWDSREANYYTSSLCTAQLCFEQGLLADIVYGKGEQFTYSTRTFEVYGNEGTLIFESDRGRLVQGKEETPIDLGSRRGLFNTDTQQVLNHLTQATPLYVQPQSSLYALRVSYTLEQAAKTGDRLTIKGL